MNKQERNLVQLVPNYDDDFPDVISNLSSSIQTHRQQESLEQPPSS